MSTKFNNNVSMSYSFAKTIKEVGIVKDHNDNDYFCNDVQKGSRIVVDHDGFVFLQTFAIDTGNTKPTKNGRVYRDYIKFLNFNINDPEEKLSPYAKSIKTSKFY